MTAEPLAWTASAVGTPLAEVPLAGMRTRRP